MDRVQRDFQLGEVFTPAAPIARLDLFAGRSQQRGAVIDAVAQRGRHAILFGERGVGKTSLASIIQQYLEEAGRSVVAPRVNCDDTDTYASIWRKVFDALLRIEQRRGLGFRAEVQTTIRSVGEDIDDLQMTPHEVRRVLEGIGHDTTLIVIIDEFDRVAEKLGSSFADTIKMSSDQSVPATLILVGVGDNVGTLIREHESIERALAQVRMPRMSPEELLEIIGRGLSEVDMKIEEPAKQQIVSLSQGLPHYTHLIMLYGARNANAAGRDLVTGNDVTLGIREAVQNAQQSIVATHHRAVMSSRSDSLYREVALACALAPTDELGYFTAGSVRRPMSVIMGRPYEIPAFARHMNDFCGAERGFLLTKIGSRRNYRFRFRNPLLQPFIIMDGLANGLIDEEKIRRVQRT